MKRVLLLTTGGTIACEETSSGLIPSIGRESLVEKIHRSSLSVK